MNYRNKTSDETKVPTIMETAFGRSQKYKTFRFIYVVLSEHKHLILLITTESL